MKWSMICNIANREIEIMCRFILLLVLLPFLSSGQKNSGEYVVEKLGSQINTPEFDETTPVLTNDGNELYFTRIGYPIFRKNLIEEGKDLSDSLGTYEFDRYLSSVFRMLGGYGMLQPHRSNFNQDIWIAKGSEGEFSEILHPEYPLNNALPNAVCALTPDQNEVILLNEFPEEGGMEKGFSRSVKQVDGGWSKPEAIEIEGYDNHGTDVSMTMSLDGQIIIYAMKRPDTRGSSDLYISFKKGENAWGKPINMGSDLNSHSKEYSPFLSPDGRTLFFASDRHTSSGGSDIFMATRKDDSWTNWSVPRKFVNPINSPADESQPYFHSPTGYLYFTSNRDGSSDIFRVKLSPAVPIAVNIKGNIINGNTGEILSGNVAVKGSLMDVENIYACHNGNFRLTVPKGQEILLNAQVPGYISEPKAITFKSEYVYFKDYQVDLYVFPLEPGMKIETDPIFFKQSSPVVLESSYPALDKLAKYLTDHPSIYIRVEGHTDNQGDHASLEQLSFNRAGAIKDYLVYERFINPVRIETMGFGPDRPLNGNRTAKERAQNRRVEVIITSFEEDALGMKLDSK